ncbi:uncharacterized protein LOC111373104 [Olea europaea subsp. europaea]|uniref:Uncharacterized protein LOC111373104 n=1 Tax=Olea europaea subsp. europaea TaxID=158383 RepID=A0A8S0UH03_OLEEU|nr:uncharacterized protein LOC111373104 [Olea europaea subsp. europaea]
MKMEHSEKLRANRFLFGLQFLTRLRKEHLVIVRRKSPEKSRMPCYSCWPHSQSIFSTSTVKTSNPQRFLKVEIYRPRQHAVVARAANISVGKSESAVPIGKLFTYSSSPKPLIDAISRFKINVRPSPEFGLISLLFVLSMALGAILSLAIIAIPAMFNLRRLAASMDKLSALVSKEVPGTLLSLKLSSLEIKDLTQQLSILKHVTKKSHSRR